jgi:pteridine reductase
MKPLALITGAAKRLGACTASHLHERGFDIIIHYHRSSTAAEHLVTTLNARRAASASLIQADLTDPSASLALIEKIQVDHNRLDCLINNANRFEPTPLGTIEASHAQALFQCNFLSPVLLAQAAWPLLREQRGCIINVLDIHAEKPPAQHLIYATAKAALASATLGLATEMAPNVRVNGVAPGTILWPTQHQDEAAQTSLLQQVPLQTLGQPTDIARTIGFLACDAPYITGQIIAVDGGRTARGYDSLGGAN